MKKKNKKNRFKVVAWVLVGIVVLLAIGAIIAYSYATDTYKGAQVRIYVDASTGDDALSDSLTTKLGEDYGSRVYKVWSSLSSIEELKSGSFVVEEGEPAWQLARRIKNNRQDPVKVTFNNLRTFDQFVDVIDRNLKIDAAQFDAAVDSMLSERGASKAQYPAYFLPDTYEFYWNAPGSKAVATLLYYYDKFWTDERKQKAAELGLTPAQVSIVASIVEEETNKLDERPKVARVYLNRVSRGMKLQADPTVKFAVGDFSLRRITRQHLNTPSPYNTYLNTGLPPGPIRFPEAATLDAVLNAPAGNYIYMCAKEDFSGYHNFTDSYDVHLANARRYRQALDNRGIR